TTLSLNNVRNATRDKQSNSALATSEAGVAEAIEFIRSGQVGLSSLNCPEPAPGATPTAACNSNPLRWANPSNPMQVRVDGGTGDCLAAETCYKVWIGTVVPYDPPAQTFGIYRIHSRGEFGGGPAARNVTTEVRVEPYPFPIGVFSETLTGAGGAEIRNESLFTFDCVEQRQSDSAPAGGLRFNSTGVDLQWDLPPTAHSVQDIVNNNNCSRNQVHSVSTACNPTFPYDQSGSGGSLTSTSCYRAWTSPYTGKRYPDTSKFTIDDLQQFDYRPRGLSDSVYSALKSRAQATGTYTTSASGAISGGGNVFSNLAGLGGAQAVLYFDVGGADTVRLGPGDIPAAYFRSEVNAGTCSPSNIVIVVSGGGLTSNSMGSLTGGGQKMVASLFVPDGSYDGAGNLPIIGTIFAKEMKLAGTADFRLDQC
ncbi:MAG: hypothetical protein ACREXY_18570, partial [Gammaproteobacteria bacterium]